MIEMVPNVSEGRRPEVVEVLRRALTDVAGVTLLDATSDPSHHRSVFTVVGDAPALHDAAVHLVRTAVTCIDLRSHQGAHPRIGAVDVVPFIPLDGSTMTECIALAKETGYAIADTCKVPVYLYERAASRPERTRLESVRRGQFEGLAEKMQHPDWLPDFGPAHPHPTAGATAVGARLPLIAFNIDLEGASLDDARQIATVVRESGGGLPGVKALGLWLPHRDRAQVSINLTDYTRTPLVTVFDTVAAAAHARGVRIKESELIGLLPAAALHGTTPEHLRLTAFDRSRILEEQVARAGR